MITFGQYIRHCQKPFFKQYFEKSWFLGHFGPPEGIIRHLKNIDTPHAQLLPPHTDPQTHMSNKTSKDKEYFRL